MKKKMSIAKLEIAKTTIASLAVTNAAQIKGGKPNASRYDGCPIPKEEILTLRPF